MILLTFTRHRSAFKVFLVDRLEVDLPKLRMIHLGANSFIYSNHTVLKSMQFPFDFNIDLPALEEILLGDCALQGPNRDDCSLEMCSTTKESLLSVRRSPCVENPLVLGAQFLECEDRISQRLDRHFIRFICLDLPHECTVHLPISFRRCSNIQYSSMLSWNGL